MSQTTQQQTKLKPVYPHIQISNKAMVTIYYIGGTLQKVYFETRKKAEEAVAWIGHEFGRVPPHDIKDIT